MADAKIIAKRRPRLPPAARVGPGKRDRSPAEDILHDWGDTTIKILLRDNLRCVYCGLDGNKDLNAFRQLVMGFDHVVPKSFFLRDLGPENLVTCCWTCNRWKGQRDYRDLKPDGSRDPHTPREKIIENVKAYLRSYDFDYYEQARKALMARRTEPADQVSRPPRRGRRRPLGDE